MSQDTKNRWLLKPTMAVCRRIAGFKEPKAGEGSHVFGVPEITLVSDGDGLRLANPSTDSAILAQAMAHGEKVEVAIEGLAQTCELAQGARIILHGTTLQPMDTCRQASPRQRGRAIARAIIPTGGSERKTFGLPIVVEGEDDKTFDVLFLTTARSKGANKSPRLLMAERLRFSCDASGVLAADDETIDFAAVALIHGDGDDLSHIGYEVEAMADPKALARRLIEDDTLWGPQSEDEAATAQPRPRIPAERREDEGRPPTAGAVMGAWKRAFARDFQAAGTATGATTPMPDFSSFIHGAPFMKTSGALMGFKAVETTYRCAPEDAKRRAQHFSMFPETLRELMRIEIHQDESIDQVLAEIDAGSPLLEVTSAMLSGSSNDILLRYELAGSRQYRHAFHAHATRHPFSFNAMISVNALQMAVPAKLQAMGGTIAQRSDTLNIHDNWRMLDVERLAKWLCESGWIARSKSSFALARDSMRAMGAILDDLLDAGVDLADAPKTENLFLMFDGTGRSDTEGTKAWRTWRAAVARTCNDLIGTQAKMEAFHARIAAFERRRLALEASMFPERDRGGAWLHVFDRAIEIDGVTITPLTSREELVTEGAANDHCVAVYGDAAAHAASMIASLSGHGATSTAEIAIENGKPSVAQHKGPGNEALDMRHMMALAKALAEAKPDVEAIAAKAATFSWNKSAMDRVKRLETLRKAPEAARTAYLDALHEEVRRCMGRSDARLTREAWTAKVFADPTLNVALHPEMEDVIGEWCGT